MPRYLPAVVFLLLIEIVAPLSSAELRTWSDATGQFKVQAELVSQDARSVRLRLENGRVVEVAIDKLGNADQEYLRKLRAAPDAASRKLADAALAMYTFDDSDSTEDSKTAHDLTSHAAHGEIRGAAYVSGIVGQALKFDGRDDHVQIPKLIQLLRQDRSAISVSLWIRQPAAKVCFAFDAGHYGESVSLQFNVDHARFLIPSKAGGQPVAFQLPSDDRWHHYAVVWDGKSQRVYIDTREVANVTTKSVGRLTSESLAGPAEVMIGSQTKEDRQSERYFSGEIDEVAFFSRPLEPSEIGLLYRLGNANASLADLMPPQPDGPSTVASVATVRKVTLDIGEVTSIRVHQAEKHVQDVSFSSDGAYLATVSNDGTVKVWSAKDGQPLAALADIDDNVRAVKFLGSNELVAFSIPFSRESSAAHAWNWRSNQVTELKVTGESQWLDYSVATDQLVSPYKKLVSRWNTKGEAQPGFVLPDNGQGCDITADGQQIALVLGSLGREFRVALLDVANGKISLDVATSEKIFYDVAVSDDGRYAAAAHAEDRIFVVDTKSKRKRVLKGHLDSGAYALEFLPQSHVLASAGWLDGHIRFWDAASGKEVGSIEVLDVFALRSMAISPDGRFLAVGDDNGMLRWWQIQR